MTCLPCALAGSDLYSGAARMPPWVLGTLAVGGGLLAILMMSRAGEKGACLRYRSQYRSAASRGDIEDVEILESKAREAGCDWVGG